MNWPPNYTKQFMNRQQRLSKILASAVLVYGAKEYYKDKPVEFIEDWCITYDPRNTKRDIPTTMPFLLFPRQKEFIYFVLSCLEDEENGLIEKSRDMGVTWLCCAFSVWLWIYHDGSSVGWGSRKEQLVDKIGDPDSIFEKMRMIIENLPGFLLPTGFNDRIHSSFMKLLNPDNGATITGEGGDNIGRGGRKLIYFKDESAHYERPEKIEAALGDNTNVQIDISSVHGTANVFARRRQQGEVWYLGSKITKGVTRVFVFDWSDHPMKDQAWYDRRQAKAAREGLSHIFAQEVDRDYSAAVEGVLIPAIWVNAAIDLHKRIDIPDEGKTIAGLDVADEGGDLNALAIRKGITLFDLDKWAQGDTGQTATKAVSKCKEKGVTELDYDCIGVGSGVKAETNRLKREKLFPKNLEIVPWNAASAVLDPDKHFIPGDKESSLNKDLFLNLKAQAGWRLRIRFEKTYKIVHYGIKYPIDELININSDLPYLQELKRELSQPTIAPNGSGKLVMDKKPDGAKSPNLFDAVNIAYCPWYPNKKKRVGVW